MERHPVRSRVVAAFERLIARKPDWAHKETPRVEPEPPPLKVLGQRGPGHSRHSAAKVTFVVVLAA